MFRFLLPMRGVFLRSAFFVQSCYSPAFENNMSTTETIGRFRPTLNEIMFLEFKLEALNPENAKHPFKHAPPDV